MKLISIFLLSTLLVLGCKKEDKPINNNQKTPLLIKVDAIQKDGSIISSSIVLIK